MADRVCHISEKGIPENQRVDCSKIFNCVKMCYIVAFVNTMEYYVNFAKACYICFGYISLIMEEWVALSPYLPNTPKWSNKELNDQYLGKEMIGRAGGQRRENK